MPVTTGDLRYMSLKVGITGGIGSGKSVVCDMFRLLGIPIFNSDLEGRFILETDLEVISSVKQIFGAASYPKDGKPDRAYIASQAFVDADKLSQLNAVIHPAVNRHFEAWCKAHEAASYVIKEAAILVESGAYKQLDVLILVTAPETLRLERAAARDHLTVEEVRKRSRNQLPEEELRKYANHIIINDGSVSVISQVMKLHDLLKAKAVPA